MFFLEKPEIEQINTVTINVNKIVCLFEIIPNQNQSNINHSICFFSFYLKLILGNRIRAPINKLEENGHKFMEQEYLLRNIKLKINK